MKRHHLIFAILISLLCGLPCSLRSQNLPDGAPQQDSSGATKQIGEVADPNAIDAQRTTQLMTACRWGKGALVQELLNRGARADSPRSPAGRTPLMITCAYYGGVGICQLLVLHGADVNAMAKDGSTALMLAAESAKISVVEYLLANGADPNRTDKNGRSALDYAMRADPDSFPTDVGSDITFDKEAVIARLKNLMKR